MIKYQDIDIIKAVSESRSFNETLKNLSGKTSGSSYMHLKKRIVSMGIDTSHFNPHWNTSNVGGKNKIHFLEVLVLREDKTRDKTARLRKAMLHYGFEYICSCGINKWLDKEITLQIDHINGISYDNRPENLRFLCPNCHSQTETYGYKGN